MVRTDGTGSTRLPSVLSYSIGQNAAVGAGHRVELQHWTQRRPSVLKLVTGQSKYQ
jgi:hypothetical protein